MANRWQEVTEAVYDAVEVVLPVEALPDVDRVLSRLPRHLQGQFGDDFTDPALISTILAYLADQGFPWASDRVLRKALTLSLRELWREWQETLHRSTGTGTGSNSDRTSPHAFRNSGNGSNGSNRSNRSNRSNVLKKTSYSLPLWRRSTDTLRKNSSNNRSNPIRKNSSNNRNRWRTSSNALSNRWRSASNTLRKSTASNRPVTRRTREAVCQEDRKMYHIPCDRVWDLPCAAAVETSQLVRLADDAKLCAYLRQRAIDDACVPDDAGHRGAVDKIVRLERCLRRRTKNRR